MGKRKAPWIYVYEKGFLAGVKAREDGLPKLPRPCPYEDKRKLNNKLTWSRSFITAWCDGWDTGYDNPKIDRISNRLT